MRNEHIKTESATGKRNARADIGTFEDDGAPNVQQPH